MQESYIKQKVITLSFRGTLFKQLKSGMMTNISKSSDNYKSTTDFNAIFKLCFYDSRVIQMKMIIFHIDSCRGRKDAYFPANKIQDPSQKAEGFKSFSSQFSVPYIFSVSGDKRQRCQNVFQLRVLLAQVYLLQRHPQQYYKNQRPSRDRFSKCSTEYHFLLLICFYYYYFYILFRCY